MSFVVYESNGAIDNATSIGGMLEIARAFFGAAQAAETVDTVSRGHCRRACLSGVRQEGDLI